MVDVYNKQELATLVSTSGLYSTLMLQVRPEYIEDPEIRAAFERAREAIHLVLALLQ